LASIIIDSTRLKCFASFPSSIKFDEFGPAHCAAIVDFIKALDKEIAEYPTSRIVICVNQGRRLLTNAFFAILKLNWQ
jgi:hypothetical protein